MVYFVGRDVDVYVGTEETANSLCHSGGTAGPTWATGDYAETGSYVTFAVPRASGTDAGAGKWDYINGVDLSIGAMDEDITYLGFRDVTKIEIKKETTVTLTRKKVNQVWDDVFNNARFCLTGSSLIDAAGLTEPKITDGYRIWIRLKTGTEVFTIRNACIQSHTVTTNADGTSDETMEFMSYIDPKIGTAAYVAASDVTDL